MTTIAADSKRGLMACDSMASTADSWWPTTKVHRTPDALIGGAGETAAIRLFVAWYKDGQRLPKPKLPDTFCCLVLNGEGLYYWASNLVLNRLNADSMPSDLEGMQLLEPCLPGPT